MQCLCAGAPLSSMTSDALLALLELHVLPPVAGLLTPWTTPFLATSPTLPTWLGGGNSLTAGKAANGYVPRLEEPAASDCETHRHIHAICLTPVALESFCSLD